MHVDIVPNRSSRPTVLLRETRREDGRVRKDTVANLTKSVTLEQAEMLRRVLKGETLVAPQDAFEAIASKPHGHVMAVLHACRRLKLEGLLASRPSRERSLVWGMVAQRVLAPHSKLATTRAWASTTLADELGVGDATEDELYGAMDWLIARQARIEAKLAKRHLKGDGAAVLYDVSSSYVLGAHCELAEFGHNRDGKRGTRQVTWGLISDPDGRPVSVRVFPGSTVDSRTLDAQIDALRERFSLERFTIVGDRGMITQEHIDALRKAPGVDWVTALKSPSLKKLVADGTLQPSLFEETNLAEIQHPDYPGERLIACRNPVQGRKRAHQRQELLAATERDLAKIGARVEAGRLTGSDKIGVKVGTVLNKHKMGKHFLLTITDETFAFEIDRGNVAREAVMDGIYIIRTSLPHQEISPQQVVRTYKDLRHVERAFRTMKSPDLQVRPIHHRLTDRVKAHFLLCMLAYYVRWHLERAWAPLTFKDPDPHAPDQRDPIAPATRSEAGERKAQTGKRDDGTPASPLKLVLDDLANIARITQFEPTTGVTFPQTTTPTPIQQQALDLLDTIKL